MQKPSYSPTQYCVWEGSVKIQSKLGKDRIDGEPMEFEWTNFPGFTTLQILAEIQTMMAEMKCEPEQFQGRIIFMSMYSDIVWREKETEKLVYCEFQDRCKLCLKIRARTLVVSSALIRIEGNSRIQTKWRMGRCR